MITYPTLSLFPGAVEGLPEIVTVDFTGKTGEDFVTETTGLGLKIGDPEDATSDYIPWFETGSEGDPAGNTIEIDITPLYDAAAIAEAFATKIQDMNIGWTTSLVGLVVTLTSNTNRNLIDAVDIDSGLIVITTQQGAP